jgi:ADP-ribose pyrophosphatase YjhB (NUDIX family)
MIPNWLEWARKIQSLAQAGLTYSTNDFDQERYHALLALAAEMSACGSGLEIETVEGLFHDQTGYTTPKVDVRGAIFRGDKLLLVREMLDNGRWTLPGGWADSGETPRQAVEREVWEETGYQVRATKLAAVLDRDTQGHPAYFFTVYKFFFLGEITGGSPAHSIETGESDFFSEEELPELSIARVTEAELRLLFLHHRQPELPTGYD